MSSYQATVNVRPGVSHTLDFESEDNRDLFLTYSQMAHMHLVSVQLATELLVSTDPYDYEAYIVAQADLNQSCGQFMRLMKELVVSFETYDVVLPHWRLVWNYYEDMVGEPHTIFENYRAHHFPIDDDQENANDEQNTNEEEEEEEEKQEEDQNGEEDN